MGRDLKLTAPLLGFLFFIGIYVTLRYLTPGRFESDELSAHWLSFEETRLWRELLGLEKSKLFQGMPVWEVIMSRLKNYFWIIILSPIIVIFGVFGLIFLSWDREDQLSSIQKVIEYIKVFALLPQILTVPLILYLFFPDISQSHHAVKRVLVLILINYRILFMSYDLIFSHLQELMKSPHYLFYKSLGFSGREIRMRFFLPITMVAILAKIPTFAVSWLMGSVLADFLLSFHGLGGLVIQSLVYRDWSLFSGLITFVFFFLLAIQKIAFFFQKQCDPRLRSTS